MSGLEQILEFQGAALLVLIAALWWFIKNMITRRDEKFGIIFGKIDAIEKKGASDREKQNEKVSAIKELILKEYVRSEHLDPLRRDIRALGEKIDDKFDKIMMKMNPRESNPDHP